MECEGSSSPSLRDANIVAGRPRFPSRRPVERRQALDMICPGVRAWMAVVIVAVWSGLLVTVPAPQGRAAPSAATFVDITPDNEGPMVGQPGVVPDCPDPCASGRNGGRVNGLAGVPGDASTYFAASEVGGLFTSTNGGASWIHLDGHVPSQTWDVAAAPGGQRVYATSFYDGRVDPLTGLEVSKDGGFTWSRPPLSAPATCPSGKADQPSGFGIAVRLGTPEVFVGTNCGIARSPDAGDTWVQFDPTPGDGTANSVWDVVALPGGRTYACGDDGLLISPDGQASTWQTLNKPSPFPGGFCSLAVSPDEPNVVFVVFGSPVLFGDLFLGNGGEFFEGHIDFGGATPSVSWSLFPTYPDDDPNPLKKQRVPFVVTNDRSQGFDLWLGDGSLWRVPCSAQQTPSCPTDRTQWSGSFTDHLGTIQDAHGDSGDLEFDPTKNVDACPTLYSSDGGIHRNTATASPGCHDPVFRGANVGMHAFMLWGLAGVSRPGEAAEDIYFATQDTGLYYTGNAGAAAPTWTHGIGADVFDVVADTTRVVATFGNLMIGDPGFTNMKVEVPGLPSTSISQGIVQAGPGRYWMVVKKAFEFPAGTTIPIGVRETNDIATDPLGSPLGTWPSTAKPPCHIGVGVGPGGPQPYVLAGAACVLGRPDVAANQLWTYEGGTWKQILPPAKQPGDPVSTEAGFGVIAVDPSNPNRLYASVVRDGPPRMMRSINAGTDWEFDEELTELMSGGGKFVPETVNQGDGIMPYLQPMMVAFDPFDPNILVAGGYHSGVFLSSDGGESWALLTDPFTPGTTGIPHLPRPLFAHFDHDKPGVVRVYLGSGRGIWRVELPIADLRITKTGSSDPAYAGESLTYTITVANDGPSDATGVSVTDTLPSDVIYASSSGSCVESPTGTLTCAIGALAAGAQMSFTVTVDIPANLVYANGGPKTITNSASVSGAQLDTDPSDNAEGEDTLVKAKADVAIDSFGAVAPPPEVLIGQPVELTLRKVITNHGPSSPVDVSVSRTATAPAGSSVSPAASSETAGAVAKDEQRTVDERFTITCGVPGAQTFSFANTIAPADSNDVDPDPTNNNASTTVTVECVVPVAINIQPGSFPNAMNLNGGATVAVLTTKAGEYGLPLAFNATNIDPLSVLFGPASLVFPEAGGATESHLKGHIEDSRELDEKTRDKDMDMVLHFRVAASGLTTGSTEACVKGTFTASGGATYKFFGCDSVKVSP